MMAAGLPGTAEEHAQSVTNMAFDMREVIEKKDTASDIDLEADLEVCTWRTTCNRKIPIAGKFGRKINLAVWWSTFAATKLKFANISYLHVILYRTTKSKSANMFVMVTWDQPQNLINSNQDFRLYSNYADSKPYERLSSNCGGNEHLGP